MDRKQGYEEVLTVQDKANVNAQAIERSWSEKYAKRLKNKTDSIKVDTVINS